MDIPNRDRVYVDKNRAEQIRKIKGANYFEYDNHKDVFMTALALGIDCYNGEDMTVAKEAFFNSRDLNETDKAVICAIVKPELSSLDDITQSDIVYSKAEAIADKGFTQLLEEMEQFGPDAYILRVIRKADELYKAAEEQGLLKI